MGSDFAEIVDLGYKVFAPFAFIGFSIAAWYFSKVTESLERLTKMVDIASERISTHVKALDDHELRIRGAEVKLVEHSTKISNIEDWKRSKTWTKDDF